MKSNCWQKAIYSIVQLLFIFIATASNNFLTVNFPYPAAQLAIALIANL